MREYKSDLFEYSACLFLDNINTETISQVEKIARDFYQEIEISSRFLEFEYIGRDTNRKVLKFLVEVASIIVDCEGEIVCEIENDDGDDLFQFFSIKNGKLFCQEGEIVQGAVEEVILSSYSNNGDS